MKSVSMLLLRIFIAVLAICSLGMSQSLNIVGNCPADGWAVVVAGNYAFVAADSAGLQVFDISNPANPAIVSSYDTPGRTVDLFLSGVYAYLADYSSLQVVDISNPLIPAYIGSYPAAGLLGVHINGNYAYLAFGYHPPVIGILNISNPASPESTSSITFAGGAFDVYYSNGYLSALSNVTEPYSSYLRTIDVTDPANPMLSGNVRLPGDIEIPNDVVIEGDYAFVAHGGNGLQIVNIHEPANPLLTGSYDTPGIARGVDVSGGYAFVADHNSGVQMLDIHDPANPRYIASRLTDGYATGVTVSGDYVYVICAGNFYVMRPVYTGGCVYHVGDVNNNGVFNGLDVVFSVSYFKGGPQPSYSCDCDSLFVWYVAGDVNASCDFSGLDVSYMVSYFKGGPAPVPCPDCPPDR